MGLFDNFKASISKMKDGVYVNITTPKLKQDVEFILFNLPKEMTKGIEIIEDIFDVETKPHQILVKATMNAIEIKREIGRFVFAHKRWDKQEEITRKILAGEKVDMNMLYFIYQTNNHADIYAHLNADVFSVCYGNSTMDVDQTSHAINGLYIKKYADYMNSQQYNIGDLVDALFDDEN